MLVYIGMDDTDTAESRGTGLLARNVAAELSRDYTILGVVRQQLLRDPRVPCTKNNSSKGLILEAPAGVDLETLAARVRGLMLSDFIPGSDPGLCVASEIPAEVIAFGARAPARVLAEVRSPADRGAARDAPGGTRRRRHGRHRGAGRGRPHCGRRGRPVYPGRRRPVLERAANGAGRPRSGNCRGAHRGRRSGVRRHRADGWTSPPRRGGRPTAVVRWSGDSWLPLKLD